tara:strand:- start:1714 stop:2301 length:588 start_codon:yes stop_codon:yes gene_type:complete
MAKWKQLATVDMLSTASGSNFKDITTIVNNITLADENHMYWLCNDGTIIDTGVPQVPTTITQENAQRVVHHIGKIDSHTLYRRDLMTKIACPTLGSSPSGYIFVIDVFIPIGFGGEAINETDDSPLNVIHGNNTITLLDENPKYGMYGHDDTNLTIEVGNTKYGVGFAYLIGGLTPGLGDAEDKPLDVTIMSSYA